MSEKEPTGNKELVVSQEPAPRVPMARERWILSIEEQEREVRKKIEELQEMIFGKQIQILQLQKYLQRYQEVKYETYRAESLNMRVSYFSEAGAYCYEAQEKPEMGFPKPEANTWSKAIAERELKKHG